MFQVSSLHVNTRLTATSTILYFHELSARNPRQTISIIQSDINLKTSSPRHCGECKKKKNYIVIFEVLTVMNMKMTVVRVVTPCSLIEFYRHFRGACCLHRQGDETSVKFYQTTRRNNPEDSNLRYLHVLLQIITPVACLSIVLLLWITLYESKPFHLLASAFIYWIS
jgi:hypothetical protein